MKSTTKQLKTGEKMKNHVSFGNRKLPSTTMIFNMGSATNCPSKDKGLCYVCGICYAIKAERLYPAVYPYRQRQAKIWFTKSVEAICLELSEMIDRKRKKPTLFRFNESGDFYGQACVHKLDVIACFLKEKYGIVTYGYTARKDLDFSSVSFLVKGSDNTAGNNGQTSVITSKKELEKGWFLCPADCKKCSMCSKANGKNIAFKKH